MSITSPYAAHESGFLTRRKTSPIGIGGAIAIHIGVAAVVLMMPGMPIGNKIPWKHFIAINVPLDKPPPERTLPPPDRPQMVQKTSTDTRIPEIILPNRTDPFDQNVDSLPYTPPSVPPVRIADPPPPAKPVFVEARMDPRYASRLQPDYPPARLREDEEGKVTVRVHIGTDGRVLSVEQLAASHPDFWRATQEQALKAWRFIPATRDGVPVDSVRELTVYFKMQN